MLALVSISTIPSQLLIIIILIVAATDSASKREGSRSNVVLNRHQWNSKAIKPVTYLEDNNELQGKDTEYIVENLSAHKTIENSRRIKEADLIQSKLNKQPTSKVLKSSIERGALVRHDLFQRRINPLLPLQILAALLRLILLPLRILLAPVIILLRAILQLLRLLLRLLNPLRLIELALLFLNGAANVARIIMLILRRILRRRRDEEEEKETRVITLVEEQGHKMHLPHPKQPKKKGWKKGIKVPHSDENVLRRISEMPQTKTSSSKERRRLIRPLGEVDSILANEEELIEKLFCREANERPTNEARARSNYCAKLPSIELTTFLWPTESSTYHQLAIDAALPAAHLLAPPVG